MLARGRSSRVSLLAWSAFPNGATSKKTAPGIGAREPFGTVARAARQCGAERRAPVARRLTAACAPALFGRLRAARGRTGLAWPGPHHAHTPPQIQTSHMFEARGRSQGPVAYRCEFISAAGRREIEAWLASISARIILPVTLDILRDIRRENSTAEPPSQAPDRRGKQKR